MKILLTDDNLDDAMLIKRHLKGITDDITTCETGEQAIEMVQAQQFDCMILDQILPKKSGLDVLKEIRNLGITLPVLITTGSNDKIIATKCIQAGADNYFPKDAIQTESKLFEECVAATANRDQRIQMAIATTRIQTKITEILINALR